MYLEILELPLDCNPTFEVIWGIKFLRLLVR